jgi:hypothetical protein
MTIDKVVSRLKVIEEGNIFLRSFLNIKNRCRRMVFTIFGIYIPEDKAQDLIKEINDYKWIEAEKAGKDIWKDRTDPFFSAARDWKKLYFKGYKESKLN